MEKRLESVYKCPHCEDIFDSKRGLQVHLVKKHGYEPNDPRYKRKRLAQKLNGDEGPPDPPNNSNPNPAPMIPPGPAIPSGGPPGQFIHPALRRMQPQPQSSSAGLAELLPFFMQLFKKDSPLEKVFVERAMESLLEDIKLAQKVKTIMLETPARYMAKGMGKYLEKAVVRESEGEGDLHELEDIIANAFEKALSRLSEKYTGGEGENKLSDKREKNGNIKFD